MSKKNDLPLVSVITVSYNAASTIEDTIRSVISQTYPNIEYIIIDGASTDGTVDIIKKYEKHISYWVSEPDNGIYDAMNKGLKVARGEYIGILNADDVYIPMAIEISIDKIKESSVDYSIANVELVDKNLILRPIIPLKNKIYQEMPYPHVTAIIARYVYDDVGYFDTSFNIAGDHDMALRILKKNYRYVYIDQVIGFLKSGGISDSFNSSRESLRVAIKNGKHWLTAYITFIYHKINFVLRNNLPHPIVRIIRLIKRSRCESKE
ncbi:glycosyltransferase family 2 protein [Spirochaetia bacterium 38H-sp]|uniref:Glycosyltransferase family 2 protein n=1 Tax=Rarispira pelagica TaxID=3141764 RepID=A0ABU9U9X5_9SPIR